MLEHSSNKLNIKIDTRLKRIRLNLILTSLTMLYHFIPACCEVDSPSLL